MFVITLTRFVELVFGVLTTRGEFTWSAGRHCIYLNKLSSGLGRQVLSNGL
ncbi:hypothetical protein V6Z12_A05G423400 [Gossypium hirsutum]